MKGEGDGYSTEQQYNGCRNKLVGSTTNPNTATLLFKLAWIIWHGPLRTVHTDEQAINL